MDFVKFPVFAAALIFSIGDLAAHEEAGGVSASSSILEICDFISSNDVLGKEPGWRSEMSCYNSGLPHLVEAGARKNPFPGEKGRARAGDLLYREDLTVKVRSAVLNEPVEISTKKVSRRIDAGALFRLHAVSGKPMYCWFDQRPFTNEELSTNKIRVGVFWHPPFESVCLLDNNNDGIFVDGLYRPRGSIKFSKIAASATYEFREDVFPLESPASGFGFPGAGEPLASRFVYLDVLTDHVGVAVQSAKGGAAIAYFSAPVIGGTAEIEVHGLKIVLTDIGPDGATYAVTGALDAWMTFN